MLKRKRMLVISGAGASMALDIPSVTDINDLYEKHSLEYVSGVLDKSPIHLIKSLLNEHCIKERQPLLMPKPLKEKSSKHFEANFESLQYALNIVSSVQPQIPFIDCSKRYLGDFFPLYKLLSTNNSLSSLDPNALYGLQLSLRYQVYKLFVDRMKSIDKHPLYPAYKDLLKLIRRKSHLSIATLSYDDLLLKMLPNLNNGFDRNNGPFKPDKLINDYWGAYLHLHGSIHFRSARKKKLEWVKNPSAESFPINMGSELRTDEGIIVNTYPMIIGYSKPDAILCNPYRLYFSVLERQIFEADVIVIIGYGFGDFHLNRYLSEIRNYNTLSKLLLIIDSKRDNYSIDDNDPWSRTVRTIFGISNYQRPFYNRSSDDGFIERRIRRTRLLIWTRGLQSIIENPDVLLTKMPI